MKAGFLFVDTETGAAWPSSARVVRCLVKSSNERNPCCQLPASKVGDSGGTAQINWEEGGDDVRSVWPLCLGLHTYYNAQYRGKQASDRKRIPKSGPSSDCSLQLDYMKPESLVIAGQHTAVNVFLSLVHTARQATKAGGVRSRRSNLYWS